MEATAECWPIANPVHPQTSIALQVGRAQKPPEEAVPKAMALTAAAVCLAAAHKESMFGNTARLWLLERAHGEPGLELGRRLMDPAWRVLVPLASGEVDGWWIQLSQRIRFITRETPVEPVSVERLASAIDGVLLVADEPILIVARITSHPSDWVFVARVWAADGVLNPGPWRAVSPGIHGHGVPILSLDEKSTPEEIITQILLAAYWHGYLDRTEVTVIPEALASAFPGQVARVRRGVDAPSNEAAATLLFERLLRPGFDPARGAGAIRRYIARHATTLIRAHRTTEAQIHPWDEYGIKERHYYKLLAKFEEKGPDGRYLLGDAVKEKIRDHVEQRRRREAKMNLLRGRGFGDAAARKWLQRHPIDGIATARPRRPHVVN